MIAISLQSGSNGNCLYVEAGGAKLLFDAGISGIQAQKRLAALGRDIRNVDAVIISHDHRDHACCAGVYQRKYNLPLYMTPATLTAAYRAGLLGQSVQVRHFESGGQFQIGSTCIETVRTPHDAADGVAFILHAENKRLGIFTDLGHPFEGLADRLANLDAAFLESNYDPAMLAGGDYPEYLKIRIAGPRGHLANHECARLLRQAVKGRLKWACLAHLSEHNNTPDLARCECQDLAGRIPLHVASRYEALGPFEI